MHYCCCFLLLLPLSDAICVFFFFYCCLFLGAQNKCTKFLLCCLKCCFWCLEKFIKFLNRNAYIMVCLTELHAMENISIKGDLPLGSGLGWGSVIEQDPYLIWSYNVAGINMKTSELMMWRSLFIKPLDHMPSSGSPIWQKLLHFGQRCFLPSDEKYRKVRLMDSK